MCKTEECIFVFAYVCIKKLGKETRNFRVVTRNFCVEGCGGIGVGKWGGREMME